VRHDDDKVDGKTGTLTVISFLSPARQCLTALTDGDLPNLDHFKILPIDKQEEAYDRVCAQHTNDPVRVMRLQVMETIIQLTREQEQLTREKEQLTREKEQMTREKEQLTREKERLARELADTGRITGNDFCSRLQFIPASKLPPLFTVSNDVSAEIRNVTEELIEMPPEFWACHSFPQFKNPFFVGEKDTTEAVDRLVGSVIHALIRIGYLPQDCILNTHLEGNLLGATPKISLLLGKNHCLCGAIEVKKHDANCLQQIFESSGLGSGQAFVQLALCQLSLKGNSYGLISTFNAMRLLSTGDFRDDLDELRHRLKVCPQIRHYSVDWASCTPPRFGPEIDVHGAMPELELDSSLTSQKKESKCKGPEAQDMQRRLYGFEVVELSRANDSTDEIEKNNRKMLSTIANFVLLSAKSVQDGPRKIGPTLEGGVRVFDVNAGTFHLRSVTFDHGIDFHGMPVINDRTFYVWSQLGKGSTGTCWLGAVRREVQVRGELRFQAVLCTVKVYNARKCNTVKFDSEEMTELLLEQAQVEATNWKRVYPTEKWDFIQAHSLHPFVLLILPFCSVAKTPEERLCLLGLPGTEKEDCPLWKGLRHLACSGHKHGDLKWDHIGVLQQRNCHGQDDKVVYVLDLESIEDLAPQDIDGWVAKSYDDLKQAHEILESRQAQAA
jgi:hypothetical protein